MLIRREILTTFLSVLLMLIAIGYLSAADYYVCVGGAGAEDGSDWANAFAKIQDAVDACVSGADTIHVADGTYMSVSSGGDQTYPISIDTHNGIAMLGYGPRYYGPWLQGDGQSRVIVIEDSSKIVVRNFKVSDGAASGDGGGIYVSYSDDILLEHLEVTENTCNGESTNYTGNGGGMAFDYSTVDVIGCCIWKNYAFVHTDGYGGNGGAIALFNPDLAASDRGYYIRDCCIFWNEADIAGGGIILSGDDGYTVIENNLIRQNCVSTSGEVGAAIHCDCAKSYIRNNTVADNYYCEDAANHGTPPKWGHFPDGSTPQTDVYGVWGCQTSTFWMKGIHNIVYFNGPPTFDDWNIWAPTITVRYSDVDMVSTSPYPGTGNIDQDPLFEGEEDERPCNSTFYFLSENSLCIDKGIPDDDDPWETGVTHCDLVNTHSGTCDKNTHYSVHQDGSADLDYYCDDADCRPDDETYKIDLGYHYDHQGMNYIELSSFDVDAHADKVVVKWETATEIKNAGFLVYRCDNEASDCKKVSDFIVANGDTVAGATYSFTDIDVAPGRTYYYYLVDVETSGKWTAHGPVVATIPIRFAAPLLQLGKVDGLAAR